MKKILAPILFLILVSAVNASFGSFFYETEKEPESGVAEYDLGLINTGNTGYRINVNGQVGGNYTISTPEEFILYPSEKSETPREGWWKENSEGSFSRVEKKKVKIEAGKYRENDVRRAEVTLTAEKLGSDSLNSFLELTQTRQYELEIEVPDTVPVKESKPKNTEDTLYWEEERGFNLEENKNQTENSKPDQKNNPEKNETNETDKSSNSENEESDNGFTTIMLISGIILTGLYVVWSI